MNVLYCKLNTSVTTKNLRKNKNEKGWSTYNEKDGTIETKKSHLVPRLEL